MTDFGHNATKLGSPPAVLLVLLTQLLAGSITAGQAEAPSLQAAPWSGDFDKMLQRRFLRALVSYSKTQYYVTTGVRHGSSYEYLKEFESWVNRKYPSKQKNLRFHVVFVPVSRDQMIPRVLAGAIAGRNSCCR